MDFLDIYSHWTTITLCGVALVVLYRYYIQIYSHWENKGVPYLPPSVIFGNTKDFTLLRTSMSDICQKLYNAFGDHKFAGIFFSRRPILLLRDIDLIKRFMIADFSHFHDRIGIIDKINAPLTQNLFNLKGSIWRKLRIKLSPTFTSGKIKMMFPIISECANELTEYLKDSARIGECLEFKDVAAKYTTDVIGTCAFGMQFNSIKDPNAEFRVMGKAIFPTVKTNIILIFTRIIVTVFPFLSRNPRTLNANKSVSDFFLRTVKEIVDYREKNNVKRNDFMQLLIQLKNEGRVEDDNEPDNTEELQENSHNRKEIDMDNFEITDELLAAQIFVFFVGGFETSSTTISFCLHELAINPDVQRRLHEEIDSMFLQTAGQLTYEAIQNMKYIDLVLSETLRKYPPLGVLFRECTKQYKFPDTNVCIDKGQAIFIPIQGIHYDPKYYPNPEKFDPERFSEENKAKRPHFSYLPFGEGPRICIGMRFAMVQVKLGLVALLRDYEFKPCKQTTIPLRLDPSSFLTSTKDGIWLQITKRSTSIK